MNIDNGKVYIDDVAVVEASERGEPMTMLPHKPDPRCKRCKGRGSIRSWGTMHRYGACPRCYPGHAFMAITFKQYMARGRSK